MTERRFNEIEGLRGYLALWVALGHAIIQAGIQGGRALQTVTNGVQAVDVFIIISGFVITHLLVTAKEGYPTFILRRFMRLYPAFAVCCVAGFWLTTPYAWYAHHVPWAGADFWQPFINLVDLRAEQLRTNLPAQVLAHATMMHGAIPYEILDQADRTFLAQGWSISLEWQFYLLAPLVLLALRRGWSTTALTLVSLAAFVAFGHGYLGTFRAPSLIFGATPYFAIGIASRLILPMIVNLPIRPVPAACFALILAVLASDRLPLAIWSVFFVYMIYRRDESVGGRLFHGLFLSRIPRFLGRISYSIYLSHELLLIAFGAMAVRFLPQIAPPSMLAVDIVALIVTVPVSALLYRFVEKPGIALGRNLGRAWFVPPSAHGLARN